MELTNLRAGARRFLALAMRIKVWSSKVANTYFMLVSSIVNSQCQGRHEVSANWQELIQARYLTRRFDDGGKVKAQSGVSVRSVVL
jgi:hypothetical protein